METFRNQLFLIASLLLLVSCSAIQKRNPSTIRSESPFLRRYTEGETFKYRIQMTHTFDGSVTSSYDAVAVAVVKKNEAGQFYEEFQWISVADDNKKKELAQFDKTFRQMLSLTSPFKLAIPPELPKLSSFLIGPVTDLLTFYVDESLAIRQDSIRIPGDHVFLKTSIASSWGSGQDCIDFNITLSALDEMENRGSIKVSHIPPSAICITPPVDWMKVQVTDKPNNWYDIQKNGNKWTASTGMEIFDVEQNVDLKSGKILSAKMNNPIAFQSRVCKNESLLNCDKPTDHKIVRTLSFTLEKL